MGDRLSFIDNGTLLMFERSALFKRLALAYGFIATLAISYCTPAVAQTGQNVSGDTTVDPYTLCANSPQNSVCQPYHLNPVSLDDRPGEEALGCQLKIGDSDLQGRCKFSITSEQFVVYIQEGPELESLGGEQPTRVIDVSTNRIVKLLYEEDTIENRPALLPVVRVARRVVKKTPKEISLISVIVPLRSINTAESAGGSGTPEDRLPASDGSPTTQQPQPVVVTLVVEQEAGGAVRSQLESATGLPSEAPPAEQN